MDDSIKQLEQRVIKLEEALEKDKHLFRVINHDDCYMIVSPLEVYEDHICSFNRRLVESLINCGLAKEVEYSQINWKQCTYKNDKLWYLGNGKIVKYSLPIGTVLKIFNFDFKKIKKEYSYVQTVIKSFPDHPEFINYKFRMPKEIYSIIVAERCLEPLEPLDKQNKVV